MRIFTTILITSAVMLALVTCTSRRTPKDGKAAGQSPTIGQIVFKSKPLQNAFDSLVNDIDSFPNPFGPPVFTIALADTEEGDTLVDFYVYGYILGDIPFLTPTVHAGRVGVKEFDKGVVALYYDGLKDMRYLVNESAFDKESYDKYIYLDSNLGVDWDVQPSERHYRLFHRDSLNMISKKK